MPCLNLDLILQAVRAGVEKAASIGVAVSIAVVDGDGLPVACVKMPGAYPFSPDVALRKARTAAYFKASTGELAARAANNPVFYIGLTVHEGLIFGKGGVAVDVGGCLYGVGVSGGTGDQDEEVAKAVAAALRRE